MRDGRFGRRAYQARYNNWAPRMGIAYSLNPKTVIRTGGIYYVRDIGNAQFDLVRNSPYSTRRSENAQSALTPSLNWQVPFLQSAVPSFILVNQFNQHTPYIAQWSFSMEQQITSNSSLDTACIPIGRARFSLGSFGCHFMEQDF